MFIKIGEYYTNNIFESIQPYSLAKIYSSGSEYLWYDLWFTSNGTWRISNDYGRDLKDDQGRTYVNQHKIFMYGSAQYWAGNSQIIWRVNDRDWFISDDLGRGVDSYIFNSIPNGDEYWGKLNGNHQPEGNYTPYGLDSGTRPSRTISLAPFTGWAKGSTGGNPWGVYQQITADVAQSQYRYQGFTTWNIDGNSYTEQATKDGSGNTVYLFGEINFSYDTTENAWVLANTSGEGGWKTSTDLISTFNTGNGTFSNVQLNPFGEATGTKTATFNTYTNGTISGNVFDIASYV